LPLIAEAHGGTIEVRTSLGGGSIFKLRIMNSAGASATAINADEGTVAGTVQNPGRAVHREVVPTLGKVVAALRTGAGTDASVFDPDTMNAFAPAGGAGTLTIIHEDSPDKFSVLEEIDTQSGARTATLDTKTHNVITVTARHGHGSTHLDVLPDTFVVLVVGK